MLDNYYKSAKERADIGIPPLPLDAEQTSQLVELIKNRSDLYSKALYKIKCDNLSKKEIVEKVLRIYETY